MAGLGGGGTGGGADEGVSVAGGSIAGESRPATSGKSVRWSSNSKWNGEVMPLPPAFGTKHRLFVYTFRMPTWISLSQDFPGGSFMAPTLSDSSGINTTQFQLPGPSTPTAAVAEENAAAAFALGASPGPLQHGLSLAPLLPSDMASGPAAGSAAVSGCQGNGMNAAGCFSEMLCAFPLPYGSAPRIIASPSSHRRGTKRLN